MKRITTLTILFVGLLPSITVGISNAAMSNQRDVQRECRNRLGLGQTEPVYGSILQQLRRCIDDTNTHNRVIADLLIKAGVSHYSTVGRTGVSYRRETQRSLTKRVHNQERTRESYYRNVPLEDREFILQQHRRAKRLLVQEQDRLLLRQKRSKRNRWKQAIQTCRYFVAEDRHDCVQFELTSP